MDMTGQPALVQAFVAERFAPRLPLDGLISPPYDVISQERRAALARDSHNIVHLILPEGQGERYAHAAGLLDEWRDTGVLEADPAPTVTIVRQAFATPDGSKHARTGVVVGVSAEPYESERVRPHERTHRGPKEDRLALLRATHATLEPLLFLSRDENGALEAFLETETHRAPDARASLDGVTISLWTVSASLAGTVLDELCRTSLYIADGHHRYETAVAHGAEHPGEAWTLGMIVATRDPGLVVLPTHRVIVDLHANQSRLEDTISALDRARGSRHDCAVVMPDGAEIPLSLMRTAEDGGDGMELLIERVERLVVTPLLGASGGRLVYTHDSETARDLSKRGGVAVLVHPTPVGDVLAVADTGGVMPPKSTFFYPKVPSGLLIASLT